jgi:hypothetical protein
VNCLPLSLGEKGPVAQQWEERTLSRGATPNRFTMIFFSCSGAVARSWAAEGFCFQANGFCKADGHLGWQANATVEQRAHGFGFSNLYLSLSSREKFRNADALRRPLLAQISMTNIVSSMHVWRIEKALRVM